MILLTATPGSGSVLPGLPLTGCQKHTQKRCFWLVRAASSLYQPKYPIFGVFDPLRTDDPPATGMARWQRLPYPLRVFVSWMARRKRDWLFLYFRVLGSAGTDVPRTLDPFGGWWRPSHSESGVSGSNDLHRFWDVCYVGHADDIKKHLWFVWILIHPSRSRDPMMSHGLDSPENFSGYPRCQFSGEIHRQMLNTWMTPCDHQIWDHRTWWWHVINHDI